MTGFTTKRFLNWRMSMCSAFGWHSVYVSDLGPFLRTAARLARSSFGAGGFKALYFAKLLTLWKLALFRPSTWTSTDLAPLLNVPTTHMRGIL